MVFDLKLLVALVFIILSFATIFAVKTRINIITTLIITHLVLILFLSLTITNYDSFKEVVLTLIAYLMGVLFLITNYKESPRKTRVAAIKQIVPYFKIISSIIIVIMIFLGSFYLAKTSLLATQKSTESALAASLQNNNLAQNFDATSYKKNRLKKKLNENFLLKRSSDVILIIVALSSALLLLNTKIYNKNHDL